MIKEHKSFALQFAKHAGKIIRSDFVFAMKKKNKKDGSPVTKTDIKINNLLIKEVKMRFPNHSVLAEEKSHLLPNSEYVWVCDPVDGTIPFSHGLQVSTFCLALLKNGKVILGIIMDPFRKNLFFAEIGRGAYLNRKKIKVSKRRTLKSSLLFFEYWKYSLYDTLHLLEKLEKGNSHMMLLKSISYGCSLVALGESVGALYPGENPWDVAAAKIIVEEAGGKVSDFHGNEPRYDGTIKGCVLSNGLIHDDLLKLIRKTVPLES